jgi:ribonuclease HII
MNKFVGIDEVGRGPLAGPVCVGVFSCDPQTLQWILEHAPCKITDSKKMSAKDRSLVMKFLTALAHTERPRFVRGKQAKLVELKFEYAVGYSSAAIIDKKGIVFAINSAMKKACRKIALGIHDNYVLDGGLKLPTEFKKQKTIIKGDLSEPLISLASIVAKVSRDKYVERFARQYPEYGFESHKGYGTKKHTEAIAQWGSILGIHRMTFLKNNIH